MAELKKLKGTRKGLRGQLTRKLNKLNPMLEMEDFDEAAQMQLNNTVVQIGQLLNKIEALDENIFGCLDSGDEDEYNKEINETSEIAENGRDWEGRALRLMARLNIKVVQGLGEIRNTEAGKKDPEPVDKDQGDAEQASGSNTRNKGKSLIKPSNQNLIELEEDLREGTSNQTEGQEREEIQPSDRIRSTPRVSGLVERRARFDDSVLTPWSLRERDPGRRYEQPSASQHMHIRLPELPLQTFNGEIKQYQAFKEWFNDSIGQQPIPDRNKLQYLKQCLRGDAARWIAMLPIDNPSYSTAWMIIDQRYGVKTLAIEAHMSELLSLKPVENPNDLVGLGDLLARIVTNIHGLESLGYSHETFGPVLYTIIPKLIPKVWQRKWADRVSQNEDLEIEEFLLFFRTNLEGLERYLRYQEGTSYGTKPRKAEPVYERRKPSIGMFPVKTEAEEAQLKFSCYFCNSREHKFTKCPLTAKQKKAVVDEKGICRICFRQNHTSNQCDKKQWRCRRCDKDHNSLICTAERTPGQPKERSLSKAMTVMTDTKAHNEVLLMCAEVIVKNAQTSKEQRVFAFLDGGAQRSFIRKTIAEKLDLPTVGKEALALTAFGGGKSRRESHPIRKFSIRGTFQGAEEVTLTALEADHICEIDDPVDAGFARRLLKEGKTLADNRFHKPHKYDPQMSVLIGADQYYKIVLGNIAHDPEGSGLTAVKSRLGWLLHGPTTARKAAKAKVGLVRVYKSDEDTDSGLPKIEGAEEHNADLKRFWETEHGGLIDLLGPDKTTDVTPEEYLENYVSTLTRKEDGRYVAKYPWKDNKGRLKTNKNIAESRLKSLLVKLSRPEKLEVLNSYHKILMEYKENGWIAEADPDYKGIHTYLPHRPVERPDKETTDVRPVFDASAGKPSLNDCLAPGPNLNPETLAVLIRFMVPEYVWIADIAKAFLQIEIAEEDKEAVRFLWPRDPRDPASEFIEYKWTRLTFGLTSSPFVLRAVLYAHLERYREKYPETVDILAKSLYVDDFIAGAKSLTEASRTKEETMIIFADAQMEMRKWYANDMELQKQLNRSETPEMSNKKVLGITWNRAEDAWLYDPAEILAAVGRMTSTPTKREILKISARIHDPIGHLSPFTLRLKMIFQKVADTKIGWDDEVPKETEVEWRKLMETLHLVGSIRIPRTLESEARKTNPRKVELHVFTDASEGGYGAVAYTRKKAKEGYKVQLLMAKTRVAPLSIKSVKIPRLELMGALLGAMMTDYIRQALTGTELEIHIWTDSMIALAYIQSGHENWKQFVLNRVRAIWQLTSASWWNHVAGEDNPADHASRGLPMDQLVNCKLWWEGPQFLQADLEIKTPTPPAQTAIFGLEIRKSTAKAVLAVNAAPVDAFKPESCSNLQQLVRRTAWILRWVRRKRPPDRTTADTPTVKVRVRPGTTIQVEALRATECTQAEIAWVRMTQRGSFPELYKLLEEGKKPTHKDQLYDLVPVFDPVDKLIRVTGRLALCIQEGEELPPILLPQNNHFVSLLIGAAHKKVKHGGLQATLAELRNKFHLVRGRLQVKQVIRTCITCARVNSRHFDEIQANLPLPRTLRSNPFEVSGVDFAGPLYMSPLPGETGKEPACEAQRKGYICLFTCAVTRAIHLELVPNLTAASFMLALRRFFAAQGKASLMYSDNAKTFERVSRHLRAMQAEPEIQNQLAGHRIEWRFSPSLAPWWGGWWERMVRTVKSMLCKSIGRTCLNFEEMATLLAEIQAAINSRPITFQSDGINEPQALTPNQLMRGKRSPPLTIRERLDPTNGPVSKDSLWDHEKRLAKQLEQCWSRWRSDYLGELSKFRAAGRTSVRPPQVGELVLIHDENQKRALWPTGVISELIPGQDGKIRAVWVRLANRTVISRPVQRVYPLEAEPLPVEEEPGSTEADSLPVEEPPDPTLTHVGAPGQDPLASGSGGSVESAPTGSNPAPRHSRAGRVITLPARFRE